MSKYVIEAKDLTKIYDGVVSSIKDMRESICADLVTAPTSRAWIAILGSRNASSMPIRGRPLDVEAGPAVGHPHRVVAGFDLDRRTPGRAEAVRVSADRPERHRPLGIGSRDAHADPVGGEDRGRRVVGGEHRVEPEPGLLGEEAHLGVQVARGEDDGDGLGAHLLQASIVNVTVTPASQATC